MAIHLTDRDHHLLRAALISASCNVDDVNDSLRDDDVPGPFVRLKGENEDFIAPEFRGEEFDQLRKLLLGDEE